MTTLAKTFLNGNVSIDAHALDSVKIIREIGDDHVQRYRASNGKIDFAREAYARVFRGVEDGTAFICCHGMIDDVSDDFALCFGITSADLLSRALDEALNDSTVEDILIDFDTPGGSVKGIPMLAEKIASSPKPIHAVVSGQCCSAGYWLACACSSIGAVPEAVVGSVGVYVCILDDSEAYAQDGLKFNYITTGELKASGAEGTSLTEAQEENIRGTVEDIFELFCARVFASRPDITDDVFSGGVYVGKTALKKGLIDFIL